MKDRIRYRPISVRDLLTELHSVATLMVDLAYSAVLFNDRELAEEVIELEERADELKVLLLMNTAIAVRKPREAEAMMGTMRMATVADRISDASADIAQIVLTGLGVDPQILEGLMRTRDRIVRTTILPGSFLIGKMLGKLKLETNIGISITALRRGREVTANPSSKMILREGDIVVARGSDVGVSELDRLAKGELKSIPRPAIDVQEKHP